MKKTILAIICILLVAGCARTPYKDLNLDTTTNFRTPTEGKSGIYAYQHKTGIIGAIFDVDFEIKGLPVVSLNTGEYCYFEVDQGNYKYKLQGGLFKQYIPVEFEANKNYFFITSLTNLMDTAVLIRIQDEIDYVKKNILTGKYELCTKD